MASLDNILYSRNFNHCFSPLRAPRVNVWKDAASRVIAMAVYFATVSVFVFALGGWLN